jgi:hypothetical protein
MWVLMTASKKSGWNSILTLLGSGHQNPHETYQCRMHSRELLMMGKEVAESGQNSILTLLGSGHQNPHATYQCRMHSRELLMMGKEIAES